MRTTIPISRAIANSGLLSKRGALKAIANGRVTLNGTLVREPIAQVVPGTDKVMLNGVPISTIRAPARMWQFHKPPGLITTSSDPKGRPTIFDALPKWMPRVMSVGRLDMDSEGLLLLTTSGPLAAHLERPASGFIRTYEAMVYTGIDRSITPQIVERIEAGLTLRDGTRFAPMQLELIDQPRTHLYDDPHSLIVGGRGIDDGTSDSVSDGSRSDEYRQWASMQLSEGKNREVRRAWEEFGFTTNRLIRVAYGPFGLGSLEPGQVSEVPEQIVLELLGGRDNTTMGMTRNGEANGETEQNDAAVAQPPDEYTSNHDGDGSREVGPEMGREKAIRERKPRRRRPTAALARALAAVESRSRLDPSRFVARRP